MTASSAEEWTVVQRGRGKRRERPPSTTKPPEEILPWSPSDTEVNPERITNLTRKLDLSMKRLESSQFYSTFMEQMEQQDISSCFQKVLGPEPRLQMVVYGIGSIESYEPPRLQLSLALSIKRKFNWIGGIEVFDPVLSATESRVLESLGCSILKINEHGRRRAEKPTLFFMPHCEAELYDNLIELNWKERSLDRIALFGNSFEMYALNSEFKGSLVLRCAKHVVAVSKFADEFKITAVSDLFASFHDSSWHFFDAMGDVELPLAMP